MQRVNAALFINRNFGDIRFVIWFVEKQKMEIHCFQFDDQKKITLPLEMGF